MSSARVAPRVATSMMAAKPARARKRRPRAPRAQPCAASAIAGLGRGKGEACAASWAGWCTSMLLHPQHSFGSPLPPDGGARRVRKVMRVTLSAVPNVENRGAKSVSPRRPFPVRGMHSGTRTRRRLETEDAPELGKVDDERLATHRDQIERPG